MPDASKNLFDLYVEWSSCELCELGQRRLAGGWPIIPGEGTKGAIMLIGDAPGRSEEETGRTFAGKAGELVRDILEAYNLTNVTYLTNLVACRSCELLLDEQGQPRMYKRRGQPDMLAYRDLIPPTPMSIKACSPRLFEEIYRVDPVVIVALGAHVASFLLNRPVAITKERGTTHHCSIPGSMWVPKLTKERRVWGRKVKGQQLYPIEQNQVRYVVIPTFQPGHVLRKEGDHGHDSPWNQLALDLKLAGEVYEKYMMEALNQETLMSDVDLTEQDVRHDHGEDEDD